MFLLLFRLDYDSIKDQSTEEIYSEFVEVPRDMKGHVIGRGGYMLHKIMQRSGARVFSGSRDEEGFTVCGNEDQIANAKRLILEKVVSCLNYAAQVNLQPGVTVFYVMLCYVMLCYMLCYVMLCYVMLCYVICYVICYVMLCYVMLCYVMLCYMLCYTLYVMLCYVMLYVMLCYVMLCYVMLCYVMLCYVMLCYVMLCYVMLYVVLCYMLCFVVYQEDSVRG